MTKTSQAIPYIHIVIRLSNIRKPSYKGDSTLPRQNKQFIFTITDVVYICRYILDLFLCGPRNLPAPAVIT